MSDRCEPPEHMRGVDGWHWVRWHEYPPGDEFIAYWDTDNAGGAWDAETAWLNDAVSGRKYIYIAPVTRPNVVAALVEALEQITKGAAWVGNDPDYGSGHDAAREWASDIARAALARVKEAGI